MRKYGVTIASSCGLFLLLAAACSEEQVQFADPDAQGDGAFGMGAGDTHAAANRRPGAVAPATVGDAGVDGSGSVDLPPSVTLAPTGTLFCGNSPCKCNNGIDDDRDGTIDGFDVECTGGIDDDESSFATGIPGDNRDPKWQDCFFDGNSGAGDDRCRYPTECLTGELSLSDDACAVTQACRDNCQPRTPAGCDCFGCCAIALPGGGEANVLLQDSCSLEKIGDAEACPVCTPTSECVAAPPTDPVPNEPDPNEPDPNEPDPNEPDPGDPTSTCDGRAECDEAGACDVGLFCSQGCCLVVIR
jgi:hypothetical protein